MRIQAQGNEQVLELHFKHFTFKSMRFIILKAKQSGDYTAYSVCHKIEEIQFDLVVPMYRSLFNQNTRLIYCY